MNKKVSIIMVNYNGVRFLGENNLVSVVKSFLETNYSDFEFIFVDNDSDDGSFEIISNLLNSYHQIKSKIIKNNLNLGFAGGCNVGIKYSEGDYICLVNNDDKVYDKNWLKELLKILEKDAKIGAVFAKKIKWDNPSEVDARGMFINPAGIVCNRIVEDKERFCLIWQTPVVFRRNLIEKIGDTFFDDSYVILHDDTDSSLKIWLAGYKIVYVPTVNVLHKRSATMKQLEVEFVAFHGRKNIIQTIIKNYETINVIKWLPVTLTIYVVSIFYYLAIKRIDQAKATLRALYWVIKNLGIILKKRKLIQEKVRKVPDKVYFKLMCPFSFHYLIKREKLWPR